MTQIHPQKPAQSDSVARVVEAEQDNQIRHDQDTTNQRNQGSHRTGSEGSELVQKYIGEGSRMVRELFVMAREHALSIIFMDEIDSIGSSRVEGS
jgi:SpoVK/Ycf46/Vps4 family AAA+-type ATPase